MGWFIENMFYEKKQIFECYFQTQGLNPQDQQQQELQNQNLVAIMNDDNKGMEEENDEEENDEEIDMEDNEEEEEIDIEKQQKNEFKEKVIQILKDNGFGDKRSSKMQIDEFLKLLYIFNQNDIHFK
ncbi:hypothetical protein PPERSA_08924 [Pseudocohnilembus persalinus]|uniref:Uncharacterized protein n=1 Tax=Pseudocohnilembus persalinus TaxID=266149 RepID=A0A0V0R2U1_PSEPJ|nr:hypothetical protein PPERSA_08924 [Pseudocohnilembus persalinus]|eukprot:KRX08820.1 hypothetical protein PPERSA_08924 [Pseudocohnilembus persalinus]